MLDKFRGMNLISRLPCVVTFGIALPFDEILKPFRLPKVSVCDYSFNFVFLFSIDEVRWWSSEVRAMGLHLMVWC